MSAKPEGYPFSSFRFYASGSNNPLITPDPLYIALSDNEKSRRKLYMEFVVDSSVISSEKIKNQLYLGSDAFVRKMEQTYGLTNRHGQRGRPRKEK